MDELIVLREFLHRHEAGLAQGLLQDKKIESVISGDDGLRPNLTFGNTIKLLVEKKDYQRAKEILSILNQERKEDAQ